MTIAIKFENITAAAQRLEGAAVHTPLLENAKLNKVVGCRVLIKPEILQHAGSFKFRGAYNRLSQLNVDEKKRGVVAWSSGNHAQGIAAAAQLLNVNATIVMPKDAPQIKVQNTLSYGANIHFYDRYTESREEIGRALTEEKGATLVPSYDDPDVIAGQGTVGLELAQQAQALNAIPKKVLIPCGGGGLCAGSAMAISQILPNSEVWAVEPQDFNDTQRSLASKEYQSNSQESRSICDALLAPTPGSLTFPINQQYLAGALAVTDEQVQEAVHFAWKHLKLVVEPGGAVALAALLSGKIDVTDSSECIGVVLSGGNVDPELFQQCIQNRE
ncbi:threonine/serine dehydratase [Colwellia sp. 6_MG-2023]|uniref:threonine ammonia-lyase n=1 Tax=Colwellia sp. 6_MG-2023 TaxID=3062676 RepID=UPI0026E28D9F|nr:threonine/serine dehydratase [Colwellia sp. 6_MG-2023]MDO6489242.1 threonine/serine dehydratase [Colwellia sp. 6_MG-2023]